MLQRYIARIKTTNENVMYMQWGKCAYCEHLKDFSSLIEMMTYNEWNLWWVYLVYPSLFKLNMGPAMHFWITFQRFLSASRCSLWKHVLQGEHVGVSNVSMGCSRNKHKSCEH